MTVFTVNAFDNGYFKDGKPTSEIQRVCFNSWLNNGINIKVFDYNSPEVIEAKIKFKKYIDKAVSYGLNSYAVDAIRFYILSLYPNMLYIDTDLYCLGNDFSDLENEALFQGHGFFAIYNGEQTELFKELSEKMFSSSRIMLDNLFFDEYDEESVTLFGKKIKSMSKKGLHLPMLDRGKEINHFISDIKDIEDVRKDYHYYLVSPVDKKIKEILKLKKINHVKLFPQNIPKEDLRCLLKYMKNGEKYDSLYN